MPMTLREVGYMKIFFMSPNNNLTALKLDAWVLHAMLQKLDGGLFRVVEVDGTRMVGKTFKVPLDTLVYTAGMRPE
ncbi:MAG: hypothetical protein NUW02_03535 [Candidatus Campbellbacteria bacterium]|nr:hypothetical protein [Candidatus Campbellbacteria bacterium]